jgi:tetratricopeptide (TPR) repeat protein
LEETRYLDFDLSLEKTGAGSYRARVLASPAGMARAEFTLPFSPIELENFILKVGRTRRGVRRLESPEMEAAKEFGGRLFKSVFTDEVQSVLRQSLDQTRQQGVGLRLRLRLNDAPELVNLPWEYLYNPNLNRFLSLSVNTPLVRYLELPEQIKPLPVEPPLRALVMIASPKDYPPLDVEHEWANLKQALSGLESGGALVVDRLEGATALALQYALRRQDYHIFHFIGHGGFDEHAQDGVLLLEDEAGRGRALSGQYLGALLHDEETLRLVVLNACEGARTGTDDPFAGAAQSLVQQGLPAVIAMQFEVTDQAAVTFSREFYSAVADGYPVDAALAEARKGIFATGNDVEWGTPVLYSRLADGKVFDLARKPGGRTAKDTAAPFRPADQDEFKSTLQPDRAKLAQEAYESGLGAYYVRDWQRAVRYFQQALKYRPEFTEASARLKDTERQLDIQARLGAGRKSAAAGDWRKVIEQLEPLEGQSDLPREVRGVFSEQLSKARREVRLEDLYADAHQLSASDQWQAVVNIFQEINTLAPDFSDPEGLLATAKNELEALRRQASLKERYSRALSLIEAGGWADAQNLLKIIQDESPGYRDAERLLQRAADELDREEQNRRAQALYAAAEAALKANDLPQASQQLQQLRQIAPSFPGVDELTARVNQAQEALKPASPAQDVTYPPTADQAPRRSGAGTGVLATTNRKLVGCGLALVGVLGLAGIILLVVYSNMINGSPGRRTGGVPQVPALTVTATLVPTQAASATPMPSPTPTVDFAKTKTVAANATSSAATQSAARTRSAVQTAAIQSTGVARVNSFRTRWDAAIKETFTSNSAVFYTGITQDKDFGTSDKKVAAGKYLWTVDSLKGGVWRDTASNRNFTDFLLSVEARKVYTCDGGYGVIFREKGGDYYYVEIDGYQFSVSIRKNDTWDELLSTNVVINSLGVNKITILAQGSHFTYLINDHWVGELTDNQLPDGGEPGLAITVSGVDKCTFEFDNFEVLSP